MRWLILASAVALAACSKAPEASDASLADEGAPGVRVSAAPGVAFDYHYAFRLPARRIAAAQEAHAEACETLGLARCRITGMRYTLAGENDIRAMLAVKLAPGIARAFGRNAIASVKSAEGTLVDAEITGTDAAAAIDALAVQRTRAAEAVQRIDARLAANPRAAERAELQAQRDTAGKGAAAAADATAAQRASLATTPMTFDYESGPAVRGFDASAPVKSALDTGIASAQVTFAFVLGAIALFGPPALALLLGWLAWVRVRPRLRTLRGKDTPPTP